MALGPGQVAPTSCRLGKGRLDASRLDAVLGPPTVPVNVAPAHGLVGGPYQLVWTADSATSYDVHFGAEDLTPPLIAGNYGLTFYDLAPLTPGVQYYWQIVAKNIYGSTPGPVWWFTAALPLAPVTPTPAHGAVDVSINANLSWTAATYALFYDVFVGLSTPPSTLVQQSAALFYDPPSPLGAETLYFWRIVSRNNAGTTAGPVWSFTTTDPTRLIIRIDGVTPHMRIAGLSIRDNLNDAPNTCSFVVDETPPHVGQVVQIGLGTSSGIDLIFAGTIQGVEEYYEGGMPVHRAWRVSAIDWWQRLNRYTVRRHYDAQSATAIATHLVTTYGVGFSTAAIAPGLPTVDGGIDFTDEHLGACLKRVMQRIGGYWYVDYSKVVHCFLTETTEPPDALVPTTASLLNQPSVTDARDLSQIRTRVLVEGGGANATIDIVAADTLVPIEDASWYNPAGGMVVSGTQRIPYTALVVGGGGSFVQGMTGPVGGGGTPTAAIGSGAGGVLGTVDYKVTFRNSAGETLPGPASNAVTGVAFQRPGAPFASAAPGLGRLVGVYTWLVTFVTARGETDAGAASSAVSLVAWAAPGIPVLTPGGFGPLVGLYGYKATFLTAYGETTAGPAQTYTATALTTPAAPSVSEVAGTVGPLVGTYGYRLGFGTAYGDTLPGAATGITISPHVPAAPSGNVSGEGPLIGNYSYRVSFVSAFGESLGTASGGITPTVVTASAPTVSGDGTGVEIAYAVAYVHPQYGQGARSNRTVDTNKGSNPVVTVVGLPAGCGWNVYSTGTVPAGTGGTAPLYLVAQMGVGVSSFTHTIETGPSDGGIMATLGRSVSLTSIALGPTGTTARRIYRTKAGGSTYYLVGQLDNNSSTSMLDSTPDAALTLTAPTTAPGKPVLISAIPTGPTGTIVRKVYRTKAGGTTYYLIGQIDNNSAGVTYTDTTPDGALTVHAPIVAAAGGEAITVTVPTGPAGTIGRRLYRTTSGGAAYRRLAEIADNGTTAYVDAQPDAALEATLEPLLSTAGGQNGALSSIPTGPTGTTRRRIYRTKAGGTDYLLAGELPNNTASTYTDAALDGELGDVVPTVNTAGASTVNLTAIPVGGASITARRLYRLDSTGQYRRAADLSDNTTTTYTDAKDEDDLGELAPTISTIGALPGETGVLLATAAGFPAGGGWAKSGSQRFRYTAVSGNSLTGIPASGPGALVAPLKAGDEVLLESMLMGATLTAPIAAGDPVHVLAIVNDTTAQAELAALEGGDSTGIYEHRLSDSRLTWADAAATGTAELRLFARPIATLRYASRDRKTVSGKTVHADIPTLGILGDYLIQTVTIDQIGVAKGLLPRFTVEASSVRWTFEDLLRQILVKS